jgi:hypothetical protein
MKNHICTGLLPNHSLSVLGRNNCRIILSSLRLVMEKIQLKLFETVMAGYYHQDLELCFNTKQL